MPEGLALRRFVVGPLDTNCYVVSDERSGEAFVIDPGGEIVDVLAYIRERSLAVKGIVITHGHVDHIAGNIPLKGEFDVPILIHESDADALKDPSKNLCTLVGYPEDLSPAADVILHDGDEISLGSRKLKVIHTPGHTPGGICLLVDGILFAGDTLFAGGVGRSDFPGGSGETLVASIREKLFPLPDETVVYPGHGPHTTIGVEKKSNPWV